MNQQLAMHFQGEKLKSSKILGTFMKSQQRISLIMSRALKSNYEVRDMV